jgi:hypothetical protein
MPYRGRTRKVGGNGIGQGRQSEGRMKQASEMKVVSHGSASHQTYAVAFSSMREIA